jgi:arsenate reductase
MTEIILYHNPRCSKSRAALELLRERGIEPVVVEYLKTPLDREALESLRRKLGREPGEWVRRGESAYGEAGLSPESSAAAVLDAMVLHPILIERPIAVRAERAVLGRPPERVLELV